MLALKHNEGEDFKDISFFLSNLSDVVWCDKKIFVLLEFSFEQLNYHCKHQS